MVPCFSRTRWEPSFSSSAHRCHHLARLVIHLRGLANVRQLLCRLRLERGNRYEAQRNCRPVQRPVRQYPKIPHSLSRGFAALSTQARPGQTSFVVRPAGSVEALLSCLRRRQAISLLPSDFQAAPVNLYPPPGLTPARHKRPLEYWKRSPSGGETVPRLCSCHTLQIASLN